MAVLLQEQDDGTCPFKVGGSWNKRFRNCSLKVVGFGLGTCDLETALLGLLDLVLVLEHMVENLPL